MKSSLTIVTPESQRTIELSTEDVRIGRSSRSDIRIPTRSVSGHHLTLQHDEQKWTVTDEHSTNGTLLNGTLLAPGTPHQLSSGDVIELIDVRLEFDIAREETVDVLTLQETGTLARELASDLLLEASDDDLARLEIDGPEGSWGEQLEDSLTRAFVGRDDDCLITLEQLDAPRLLEISRVADGFGVRPVDVTDRDSVTLNGTRLRSKTALSDGDLIEVGSYSLGFYDPLESILADLEDRPPSADHGEAALAEEHREAPDEEALEASRSAPEATPNTGRAANTDPSKPAQSGLTATEWTILTIALVLMLGAGVLLLTVFDVL
ncbi:MAG: FHA domain-containing protein [Myxococcota bacterium]